MAPKTSKRQIHTTETPGPSTGARRDNIVKPRSRSHVNQPSVGRVTSADRLRPVPGLPGVHRIKPSNEFGRILLFTGAQGPQSDVFKLTDLKSVPITSQELLSVRMHEYRALHPKRISTVPAVAVATGIGEVEIIKLGYLLLFIHPHFVAKYDLEIGNWILEAVSDGKTAKEYYAIQNPAGCVISLRMALGSRFMVKEVVPLSADQKLLKASAIRNKVCIEIFEPRKSSRQSAAIRQMYFNRRTAELGVMTRDGMFVLVEKPEGPGFRLEIPMKASGGVWNALGGDLKIGRGIVLEG